MIWGEDVRRRMDRMDGSDLREEGGLICDMVVDSVYCCWTLLC